MPDHDSLVERATEHLREALDEDDPAEKNYHIRSALQELDAEIDTNDED